MIRFAVIGTNWISHAFCQAALKTSLFQLTAVYSRTLSTARSFAEQYAVTDCYDNLEAMANNPNIDAVYIASPNSLHAPQAELFLKQGKHVIGEKPLASNIHEVRHLIEAAQQKQRRINGSHENQLFAKPAEVPGSFAITGEDSSGALQLLSVFIPLSEIPERREPEYL